MYSKLFIICTFALNTYAYDSIQIAKDLGIQLKEYNFSMALLGIFIGFIFMFFSIYVSVLVGGKK